MDHRLARIAELTASFDTHPSARFMGVKLENLCMLDNSTSHAVVKAIAKREFSVYSSLGSGDLINQGGLSFATANFAGVYAAMVHTEKHALLHTVNNIQYLKPIRVGDVMIANATATRLDDLIIYVSFSIFVNDRQKLCGHAHYRDSKKK